MTKFIRFHAVMSDAPGHEFGASCTASSRSEAYEILAENYPESRVLQLESPEDTQAREDAIWARAEREADGDYDDREFDDDSSFDSGHYY